MNASPPLLVVGLGNPGAEYATTRHNAGFIAVDVLAGADAVWKKEKDAIVTKITHRPPTTDHRPPTTDHRPPTNDHRPTTNDQRPTIFAKPLTFMNNSGAAVAALMKYYKIPLENLIVIHDDMDIRVGEMRQKTGGGSAGHNGIRSIDAAVGPDYRRIRIGVGHPRDAGSPIDPTDWVLGRFSPEELKKVLGAIAAINL